MDPTPGDTLKTITEGVTGAPTIPVAPPAPLPALEGFEVLEKLGEGGMGAVFRARDVRLGREVALKLLPPHLTGDPQWRERFEREARTAASVQHPNVVACYTAGEVGGRVFMALELVRGQDAERLARATAGKLTERRALEIVRDGARGLVAIEKAGLVHRDIKPANVFVAATGEAKLGDLGLARGRAGDDRMTQTGAILGTPAFMSPEQANGETDLDVRTDVYALGATLFQLVTGRAPFEGPSPFATVAKVLRDPTPDPRETNPHLSEGTARLIRRAMAKDRKRRHQSATELLEALERALAPAERTKSGREVVAAAARKPTPPDREERTAVVVVGGLFAALAAVGLVAFAVSGRGPNPAPPSIASAPPAAPPSTPSLSPSSAPSPAPEPAPPPPTEPLPPPAAPPVFLPVAEKPAEKPVEKPGAAKPIRWETPRLVASGPHEVIGDLHRLAGTSDWRKVSLLDEAAGTIAPRLHVKWHVGDLQLDRDGQADWLKQAHGFGRGEGAFFYELGIVDSERPPNAAADLGSGLWLTLHLRKDGDHEAVLRSHRPDRGASMRPGDGAVEVFDSRPLRIGSRGVDVTLETSEAGYRLVVAPGEKGARAVEFQDTWAKCETVRDALVKNARAWSHFGSWGQGGRGTGSFTVQVGR